MIERDKKIIEEARATIKRVDDKIAEPLIPERTETHNQRARRELTELEEAKALESDCRRMIAQFRGEMARYNREIAKGFRTMGTLVEDVSAIIDDVRSENERLKARLEMSEQRFEDLKRTVDGGRPAAEVVDLPRPRRV